MILSSNRGSLSGARPQANGILTAMRPKDLAEIAQYSKKDKDAGIFRADAVKILARLST